MCLSISDFFAEYLDFFTMDGKIEKSHGGGPPGPRGSAPASVRRFAPHSGLRSAPRARRRTPVWFFNFTIHREKVKILSKKVRDTQANPSYSAKNNVAIRMIATFMPNFFYLSFIQLFYMLWSFLTDSILLLYFFFIKPKLITLLVPICYIKLIHN